MYRLHAFPLKRLIPALGMLLAALALACGSAATSPPEPATHINLAPASEDSINPILATTVLEPGTQRVSFLLVGKKALIKAPEAQVTAIYLGEGDARSQTAQAQFHLWPYAIRGAYSTELDLDRVGRWQLDISVDDRDFSGATQLTLEVVADSAVPNVGATPPRSRTKTLASAGSFEKLTTDHTPDADLYQLTVKEAIESDLPSVIVFATPAFCTSPTCGPQVDTVTELKEAHRSEAHFVHVEIYDNPEQIQGDLSNAKLSEAVNEWGISKIPGWFNESWTFILDSEGVVAQRFEGFVTLEELEEALREVLRS
ncbi:MAG: hypothetical protein ACE5Q6_12805 [Dehalococcoidia bacterium]